MKRPLGVSILAAFFCLRVVSVALMAVSAFLCFFPPANETILDKLGISVPDFVILRWEDPFWTAAVNLVSAAFHFLTLLVGIGLWRLRPWARRGALVVSYINVGLWFAIAALVSHTEFLLMAVAFVVAWLLIIFYLHSSQTRTVFVSPAK